MEPPRPPVRIAFCITDLDTGGAEQALVQLVTRLDRQRWEPAVYCLSPAGPLLVPLQLAGVPVVCLGARHPRNVLAVARLSRVLRRDQPQLLQTYLYHANITGRMAGRMARVPRIVSGIRVAERRSRFRLWLDRMTAGLVDRHVCVSRGVAEFSVTHGGLPADRVVVIPNGVDVDRFANAEPADLAEFGIPADSRTLLFVGRLDHQKAPELLLEAGRILLPTHQDVHLLLVGEGPLRDRLARQIADGPLRGRVHLAGQRSDVPRLLKAAFALVLPSRWEGLPNVVLEAMAAGKAVVSAAVEGSAELIRHGETGLVVPPESVEVLAQAVEQLLDSPTEALRMGVEAQQMARQQFTWEATVARYDELYRQLLGI